MIIINMFYQYFTISTDLGAHIPHIHLAPTVGRDNNKISSEQWGASMEGEVTIGDHGVVPLPMGIEREDRCMGAGIQASKLSKAS